MSALNLTHPAAQWHNGRRVTHTVASFNERGEFIHAYGRSIYVRKCNLPAAFAWLAAFELDRLAGLPESRAGLIADECIASQMAKVMP